MSSTLGARDVVSANPACLLTELGDGTGVLLDLDTKFYFTLNDTGVFVWKALAAAPSDAFTLGEGVAATFEVTPEDAAEDVVALLRELVTAGLVRMTR